MKAVDTNILARALMRDEPRQTQIADTMLTTGAFVPLTVLLESAWLLRSRYGLNRHQTVAALRSVLDMPNVAVDSVEGVEWALARYETGGDLADLLHLIAARGAEAFLTFDRDVAPAAGPGSPLPIETLA